ncbi:MBL fold metallo-hydrolase [Nocardiopsis sp. EMB25]|uniref:MBL fold metallo-hydrolase n=1 Tax=Nocardiopsis TaxID=2013 RepID=UPI000344A4EE|nr:MULTISPECIES: MBL fold metallo-hydrolase [Nocardiopsis]MCY9785755.1 MBL fold metallo-hydrolase [Nocardiopsis sp. EMB25]
MNTPVVPLPLGASAAYAIRGERTVLVDTGFAGGEDRLLGRLAKAGIASASISLIVLTHCHPDHAGGAAALRRRLGVPVAVHEAEREWAESGTSELYTPLNPFGRILRRTLDTGFPAFTPDVVLGDGADLDAHGVPVDVLHTPGHTPGSVSLRHRESGEVLVGDLLAGSMTRRDRPGLPFLAQDTGRLRRSARRVLDARPTRFLFGHGRPASAASVRRFLDSG